MQRRVVLVWTGFFLVVALCLAVDLGLVNKKAHAPTMREAVVASAVWVAIGLAFSAVVYLVYEFKWGGIGLEHHITGGRAAQEYVTAYLIEEALSVDNIFVMALVLRFFRVPAEYQHRVLFWGIIGAVLFRGLMIWAGIELVTSFDWIFYVFGAVLLYTAWKMLFGDDDEIDPGTSWVVRAATKVLPIDNKFHDIRFRTVVNGKRVFTLLFLVVLVVEATDVVFAVDSIPAILGFTNESFIVMTSNVFAILGLRSLYFVVAGAMREFRYLKLAVSVILVLVAIKMLMHDVLEAKEGDHTVATISLIAVAGILTIGIVASVIANRRDAQKPAAPAADPDKDSSS